MFHNRHALSDFMKVIEVNFPDNGLHAFRSAGDDRAPGIDQDAVSEGETITGMPSPLRRGCNIDLIFNGPGLQ